ncbi:hypothetical protein [Halolamina sp. C58]|uniref:hypothetical protein n=1 Tax=Halolamina sp. C58 TaxID=3421640 RepID=UPI003EBCAB38
MPDSNVPDDLDAKHARNREQRIAAIKRWVAYIESEPPEKWGAQQNAIVNDQLEAAQRVQTSAAHKQHVTDVAADIADAAADTDDT